MSKKLISLGADFIIGLILIFIGLTYVSSPAAGFIALGVFGIVFGACYVLMGVLGFLRSKDDAFGKALGACALALYPLYVLVYVIVLMSLIGGENLSVTDYILNIILLAFALSAAVFAFVAGFAKIDILMKVFEISLIGFLAALLLTFVFPIGGGIGVVGNLALSDIILFAGYAVLGIDTVMVFLGNAKEKAEKHLVEPAKEEPANEEQPASEEQAQAE